MNKNIIDNNKKFFKNYLPFILLTIILLVMHLSVIPRNDDLTFRQFLSTYGFWGTIKYTIEVSTSSVIQSFFTLLFTAVLPKTSWVVFDTGLILLFACTLSYIVRKIMNFNNVALINWIILLFILGYPIDDMGTAGFITTTTAYISTLAFTALAFVPIVKIYNKNKICIWEYIIYFIAANIASNSLQTILYIIGIYTLFIIECIIEKRKVAKFLILQLLVGVAWLSLVFILPGVGNRKISEIRWWPDFDMLSGLQKLKLALATTTNHFICRLDLIFILLCLGITIVIWLLYKNIFYRVISLIPILFSLENIFTTLGFYSLFPLLKREYILWPDMGYGSTATPDVVIPNLTVDIYTYFPIIFQIFAFLLIFICLYLIFGNNKITILLITILGIGFITRLAMGISPTLYASNTRTFLTMHAAIMFVGLCVLCKFFEVKSPRLTYKTIIK